MDGKGSDNRILDAEQEERIPAQNPSNDQRVAIEEDHESASSINEEKTPKNSLSESSARKKSKAEDHLQVQSDEKAVDPVHVGISDVKPPADVIKQDVLQPRTKIANEFITEVNEESPQTGGFQREQDDQILHTEADRGVSNLNQGTEQGEEVALSENNSSNQAEDKFMKGLKSQKEGPTSVYSDTTPHFGSEQHIPKKQDDFTDKEIYTGHHEKMMNKKIYHLEASLSDLQLELVAKDKELSLLKDRLRVISFGDMESPKFNSTGQGMIASVEEVSEHRGEDIAELRNQVRAKSLEIEHLKAQLKPAISAEFENCQKCEELVIKNKKLEEKVVEDKDAIWTLKDLVENLKTERGKELVKHEEEMQALRHDLNNHQASIRELNKEIARLTSPLKRSENQEPGEEIGLHANKSDAIILNQDSISNANYLRGDNLLPDQLSKGSYRHIVDDKQKSSQIEELEEKLKRSKSHVERLKFEVSELQTTGQDREKNLKQQLKALQEKYQDTAKLLAQNKVDKLHLIELLTDYESSQSQEEAGKSSPVKELDSARHTIIKLEKEREELGKRLESYEVEKKKKDLELFTLKTGSNRSAAVDNEKVKSLEQLVKTKDEEIHSLNYRLRSVFDLVKKKQDDEESTSLGIQAAVDRMKEALLNDNKHVTSPQSFGRDNMMLNSPDGPISFFSNKSKSEGNFDHKILIQLISELNSVAKELAFRYLNLKLTHGNLQQQTDSYEKRLLEESELRMAAENKAENVEKIAVDSQIRSNEKLLEVEKEKAKYLEVLREKDRQADQPPRIKSFQESLHKIDFIAVEENPAVGFSVVSLDVLEVSSPSRHSPNFGVNTRNIDVLRLQKVSQTVDNPSKQFTQFQEPEREMQTNTDTFEDGEIVLKLKEKIAILNNEKSEDTRIISSLREQVKNLQDDLDKNESDPRGADPVHPVQVPLEIIVQDPQLETLQDRNIDEHHDSLEVPDKKDRHEDISNPMDTSAMTYDDETDYDWRTALWKCYFSSVNNECDEKSEHLKIRELSAQIIENINSLHKRISELEDSNQQLSDNVARKEKRMDKLIEETNQAEDIIKELVEKCDKLETELANRDNGEKDKIEEITVSDLLENIESAKKSPNNLGTSASEGLTDAERDIGDLKQQIQVLERTKRAQSRILDALIKEIVAYQSILKSDQDQDSSVELALKVLDKVLKVLDSPSIEEVSERQEEDSKSQSTLERKKSKKNLNDTSDDNPNYVLAEIPTFGGPLKKPGDSFSATELFEKKPDANSDRKPAENRERSKSIKQIREEVEAQKARISKLSADMSSHKNTAKKSREGSADNFSSRKLIPIFEDSAPKQSTLERQYASESNARKVASKIDFDSVQPHQLGECQIFFRKVTPKKLQPYPDQVSAQNSSRGERRSPDLSQGKLKSKVENMAETIQQLRERIDQNLVKIKLLEDNEHSLKKELEAKKMEIKSLKTQLRSRTRDVSRHVPEKPRPYANRSISKGLAKHPIPESKPAGAKPMHIETGADKWSIPLGSKPPVVKSRPGQTASVSPIRKPLRPPITTEHSSEDCSLQTTSRRHLTDKQLNDKSTIDDQCMMKIEKGLSTVQVKLMELINKNQGLESEEDETGHRDIILGISSAVVSVEKIIKECRDVKESGGYGEQGGGGQLDVLIQIAEKGLELGYEYIQLDEAALALAKLQSGNRTRNSVLTRVKEFIKCSESDKAKLLADQVSKGPKIAKEKLSSMAIKITEAYKRDYSSLLSMVTSRKFKLGQICNACNESLDAILKHR